MTARKRPAKKPAKRQPSVWVVEMLVADGQWVPTSNLGLNTATASMIVAQMQGLDYRVAEYRRVERKRR